MKTQDRDCYAENLVSYVARKNLNGKKFLKMLSNLDDINLFLEDAALNGKKKNDNERLVEKFMNMLHLTRTFQHVNETLENEIYEERKNEKPGNKRNHCSLTNPHEADFDGRTYQQTCELHKNILLNILSEIEVLDQKQR